MGGHPWGGAKWAKWAKKPNSAKMGKNGQKMIKKNENVADILLETNTAILQLPHYVGKK